MLSKAIFKQTFKSNINMLLIITIMTSLMLIAMIAVFDPETIKSMASFVGGSTSPKESLGDSFLNILGSTFFSVHGVLLPVIYIVLTANGLLAAQVDNGSMAYPLSTPTKRTTIVSTQAIFLIGSLIFMFLVITLTGVFGIHQFQSSIDINMDKYYELVLGFFY